MKIHYFKIHNITLRIDASQTMFPWLVQKMDYFRIQRPDAEHVDIDVRIGKFTYNCDDCLNVDHKYYGKPNELYFTHHWKGCKWKCHISGIETGPMLVHLELSPFGVLRFPWLLHAEWVFYVAIFKPLSEILWARKNCYVLHASAVVNDKGIASVFTGLGSGLKTSYAMDLVRKGWTFLGDDQVLLTPGGLLPLPFSLRTFDFRVYNIPTEYMTPLRIFRLGVHLLQNKRPKIKVAGLSEIGALNVLIRTGNTKAKFYDLTLDDAVEHTVKNCYSETVSLIDGSSAPSYSFFTAYKLMFPHFKYDMYWDDMRHLLRQMLKGKLLRRLEMTRIWNDEFIELAALGE